MFAMNLWKRMRTSEESSSETSASTTHDDEINSFWKEISSVHENLSTLNAEVTRMRQELATMGTENSKLQDEIGALKGENARLSANVIALQKDHVGDRRQTVDVHVMPPNVIPVANDVSSLLQQVGAVRAEVQDLDRKLNALEGRTSSQEPYPAPAAVCFHATLNQKVVNHSPNFQTLVLRNVASNIGNGYDPSTGKFTAPVSGTYLMATTCPAVVSHHSKLAVMMNGKVLGDVAASGLSLSSWHSVVEIPASGVVWLETYSSDYVYAKGSTSLTGILLHRK